MNPVISNNFAVTALKQGEDAFICDLTNQMSSVPVDANNKVTFVTEVKTTARIIKGAGVISSGVTPPTASSLAIAGVTPTITNTDGEVEFKWTFAKGTEVSDARYLRTLILTYDGHTYKADFTVVTDKTGAIYDLLPSMTEVPFVRDENYYLIPSSMTIYCGYTKNQDGTITTYNGKTASHLSNIDSKYYIYYRLENADGSFGSWTQLTTSGISIANSDTYAAIEFIMAAASTVAAIADSNIIDRENVPIVRQSERGFGIVCSVQRNNFTEAQWNTDPGYGVIGHQETWSDTSSLRNGARKGDLFTVVGQATDSRNGHTATYRCTNASGNLQGICIAHAISKAGDHAVRVDLDNQADLVATNSDGKVRFARNIVTKATLLEGPKPVKSGISITASGIRISPVTNGNLNYLEPTVSAVDSNTGEITITWAFTTSMTLTQDTYEVTIPITYNGVTYNAVFTLKRIDASVIYQLSPTLSSISFARTSETDNTLTPAKRTLGMNILKTDGSSSSSMSVADSGLTVRYSTSSMPGSKTAGTAWPAAGVGIANTTTATNVFVALFDTNGVLLDRETIPIVKDGVNGSSPIYADIDNEMDGVACNKDGVTTSAQSVSGYASIWKGSQKQTITALSCKINGNTLGTSYNTEGYRFSYNTSTGYCEVGVNTGITIATKVEAIITVSATIDGASVSRDLTLTINGVRAGGNGEPATIYNLLPSPSDVNVGKTDAGEYSPRYNTLKCGYKKSVGSNITSVDEVTGTIDSAYRVFFRRHTRNGDWDTYYYHYPHATYNRYLVVTSGYSTSGLDAATYDKVEFILYKDTSSTSLVASSIDTTKIIDRETVPVVADGQKGDGGPTGNGISSDEFYYCQTTTVEPPQTTYLTETYGWYLRGSANCPTAPTGKNNYLWECRYIQYSVDTSQNKKILRLVLMRDTEVKPNLLEQTAFDSEDSMDKWMHNLGSIENVGEVIPQARGALNAFGAFPTSASEKNFLQQVVFDPGVLAKIKSNEWYTLSFYARTRRYVDMDGNTYGFYFQNIYLKAGTYKLQYNGRCSVSAYNNNVSLNGYLWYSGDHGQTEDWGKSTNTSLLSKADTTVTTGNFTVSVAGYYKIGFYAYKTSGHAGTENDIVHINWWRILSVGDNSQIYTFLYPTAVKNGTTYFVDGVVKSNLPTDCNVCWQLDEDDDDCDNLGWTRHSVTFQTKSSITMAEQNVLFRMYNTYVEICMVKLEQNAMPTEWCENEHDTSTECSHNPCGTWVSGNTYYYCNGVRDVVRALDSANGGYNWFRMKRRTTFLGYKSTIQPYADTDHWEKGNKMKFTIVDSMFAEEIFTDKLTVSRLLTTPDSQGAHIEMHDAEMEIYGKFAFPNIKLGIDDDGCAVLKFFNKDGLLMYDLGPGGIEKTVSQDEVSRFINRYQLLGASDNSDSDLSDAYNYYNRIFNTKIAGNPTSMFFYEAKIVAGQFFAGSYCANADDAEEANKCFFLESASTTASGRKYIQDIAKFTGLVGWSRYGNGQTNGGLFMTDRSWNLCDQTIYEARAVPDDYDTDLDGSSLEVNFMTDYNGYYIDPIYYRTVILFVNGEQKGMRTFYYNKSKVDLIS